MALLWSTSSRCIGPLSANENAPANRGVGYLDCGF
jgi:hypothetical protein